MAMVVCFQTKFGANIEAKMQAGKMELAE